MFKPFETETIYQAQAQGDLQTAARRYAAVAHDLFLDRATQEQVNAALGLLEQTARNFVRLCPMERVVSQSSSEDE